MITVQQLIADRNVEIYEKFCSGSKYKTLSIDFGLTMSSIKRIVCQERKLRGLKKEKGIRQ